MSWHICLDGWPLSWSSWTFHGKTLSCTTRNRSINQAGWDSTISFTVTILRFDVYVPSNESILIFQGEGVNGGAVERPDHQADQPRRLDHLGRHLPRGEQLNPVWYPATHLIPWYPNLGCRWWDGRNCPDACQVGLRSWCQSTKLWSTWWLCCQQYKRGRDDNLLLKQTRHGH